MNNHPNPQIQAMWGRAVKTVLQLAPQMDPELVKSLADSLTVQPQEPAKQEPAAAETAGSSSRSRRRPRIDEGEEEKSDATETAKLE